MGEVEFQPFHARSQGAFSRRNKILLHLENLCFGEGVWNPGKRIAKGQGTRSERGPTSPGIGQMFASFPWATGGSFSTGVRDLNSWHGTVLF